MKKFFAVLLFLTTSVFIQNTANADYIIQRYETGVEKPSFEEAETYIRTTPEVTNYTTNNNNYYMTPYAYYPTNTYRIVAPPVYYGSYYPTYRPASGINISFGNNRYPINPPPPLPPNSIGPGGKYEPHTPGGVNRNYGFVSAPFTGKYNGYDKKINSNLYY